MHEMGTQIATIGVKPLISITVQCVTTQPRLSLLLLQSGLRGGRGDIKCEFRKKQRINAKSEPSKCRGLVISRRRQNYAKIGVELRPQG